MLLPSAVTHPKSLSPDAAVILGTLGICLGLFEFNRPGRILPGSLGLLLLLFACASLSAHAIRASAALLVFAAFAVLVLNAWRRIPAWALAPATLALIAGLKFLVPNRASVSVHTLTALVCGALLGSLTAVLTRIAYRARRSKALN